jgi:hypothetical protein
MKHSWLLLMASVLCLLVLFPATALSQGPTVNAGCGTATIDGVVGLGEWAPATVVDMASPSTGWQGDLLVMNDLAHLYVAHVATFEDVVADNDFLHGEAYLLFTDEGDRLDDEWAAPDCSCQALRPGIVGFGLSRGWTGTSRLPLVKTRSSSGRST